MLIIMRLKDIRRDRLTVCGFIFPLIILTKSASFIVTVQSALSAGKGFQIPVNTKSLSNLSKPSQNSSVNFIFKSTVPTNKSLIADEKKKIKKIK